MTILQQENDFWDNLKKRIFSLPTILASGASCLYLLIKDVGEELESFILTGETKATEFHVFPQKKEQAMINHFTQLGLKVTYRSQQIFYMHHTATIKYLKISNQKAGVSISLIPWFLLPNRPYPVFVYIFAIWHYHITGKKSLSQSAASAEKVFGIDKLNKSTVFRNIKAMENFIDISRIDRPLSDSPCIRPDEDMIQLIPKLLMYCPPEGSLEEIYEGMAQPLPEKVGRSETVCCVLGGIPEEYSKVIKPGYDAGGRTKSIRKRRARKKGILLVQRSPTFIDSHQIEKIRKAFIPICMHIILNAAVTYHRFLV